MDQAKKEDLAQELVDVLCENAIFPEDPKYPYYKEWKDAELSLFEEDQWGFSILMIAAENNHLPVVEFLLSKGVDVNVLYESNDGKKQTALDFAYSFPDAEVISLLEAVGAKRARDIN